MFMTVPYRNGWIHFSNGPTGERVHAQWYTADGTFHMQKCKSERGAKCVLTRKQA